MKGFKTIIFFGAVTLTGILAMINAPALENILLPALCHIDPQFRPEVPTPCMTKMITLAGAVMAGIGVFGKALRIITTTAIFKPD